MTNQLFDICSEQNADPVGQRARIQKALRSGLDIHATDKNGVTALHHAVRFRSPAAVRTLLANGANPNQACCKSGSTPLHRAVTQTGAPGTAGKSAEACEIIQLLIDHGANPRLRNKLGKTPADYIRDPSLQSLLQAGNPRRE